ncbi:hypothetical protein ABB02_00080 [Clostridiaceae bacterium JG1575]|nr:hypothetical protein ABB02_00080 [Clostridiaceae bacterium JG1575]
MNRNQKKRIGTYVLLALLIASLLLSFLPVFF